MKNKDFRTCARVGAAAAFMLLTLAAAATPRINAVRITSEPDRLTVRVSGEGLPGPRISQWKSRYTILEFNAELQAKSRKTILRNSKVAGSVQYGWFTSRPARTRVTVYTRKGAVSRWETDKTTGDYLLIIEKPAITSEQAPANRADAGIMDIIRAGETTIEGAAAIAGDVDGPVVTRAKKTPVPKSTVAPTKSARTPGPATGQTAKKTAAIPAGSPTGETFSNLSVYRAGMISLDFVDAEIGNVLKALAIQSGANIVTGPDVKGNVTVSLSGVSVETALNLITKLSNLKYAKLDNTYVVGTAQNINAMFPVEPTEVKVKAAPIVDVVRIQYGDLGLIKEAVAQAMQGIAEQEELNLFANDSTKDSKSGSSDSSSNSSSGKAGVDPRIDRYLVMAGAPSVLAAARELAEHLDQQFAAEATRGKTIEVYRAKYTDAVNLLATLVGYTGVGKSNSGSGGSSGGSSGTGSGSATGSGSGSGGGSGATSSVVFPLFPTVRVSVGPAPLVSSHSTSSAVLGTSSATGGDSGASSGSASGGGDSATVSTGPEPPMTLILNGPEPEVKKAIAFIRQIDVPAPQVRIEAKIVDINLNDLKSFGFDWDLLNSSSVTSTPGDNKIGVTVPDAFDSPSTFTLGKVWDNLSLNVTLSALFKNHSARVLARPNVTVMDGRYAEIFIGDEVKYIESISQTPTGQTIQVGSVKAGIQLNVAPRISTENNTIALNLHPEVSVITGYLDVPGGGMLPQTARRYTDTSVRVKDGETIVIGGLIREDDIKTMQKVPLLGDLPILGFLFRKEKTAKLNNEVVVFITCTIIKD